MIGRPLNPEQYAAMRAVSWASIARDSGSALLAEKMADVASEMLEAAGLTGSVDLADDEELEDLGAEESGGEE